MNCPRCQALNPADAAFCDECGARLEAACPSCGEANRLGAKFCRKCGQRLLTADVAGAVTALKFGSPETYTPRHLAEKILTSRSALEGERKQVTVLFADLKGSMELLADQDPEEARKLLDPVLERLMEAVHRYEGTVNQVMGDGIMALFGAPVAHEDHAVRACYAALAMQTAIRQYSEEVRRGHGIEVQIRVGLNSGEVVVRSIGSDLRMDYTAVGQTTHLAARMEQLAPPGSIRLTGQTLRLAEGFIQVNPLGPVPLKGLPDPVEVFELVGAGPTRRRFEAAVARGLTRFVGRVAELESLQQALEKARAGHGHVVALMGEPGVGKSRLFWEFTHSHRTQGWLLLESGSVSYGKATPYLPVIDLLRAYFQIEARDDQRKIQEKVTGKLLTLDRAFEPMLPAFLALLDVPVDDPVWQDLDPQQRRQKTLDACKHLLLRECRIQPFCLVFEDLHWIDSETQALLDSLVESLPTARILLLVNYRPEYQHGWGSKTYYTQLRIDPLPPESAEELLHTLLGADPALDPLKRLLIERTEGNPFFLEESIRTLVETQMLVGERGAYRLAKALPGIQVPATVQAILTARIDRLPPEEKHLLQSAAVIGKDVPFALLQAIAELPEANLRRGLAHLQGAEFLYEASLFPELEYTFKHALTHEVAYGSLLHETRKALHAKVVEAIERLSKDRRAEYVEELARHAVRGEVWEKSVDYLRESGAKAHSRAAFQEALERFEQALEVASRLPQNPENMRRAIDARLDFHQLLLLAGQVPRLVELHQEAEQLARQLNDLPRLGRVAYRMGIYSVARSQFSPGIEYAQQALSIAAAISDRELQILATLALGLNHLWRGAYREAADAFTRIVEAPDTELTKRRLGLAFGSPYLLSCDWLAWCLAMIGDFKRALSYGNSAVQAADALDQPQFQALAYICLAIALAHKGEGTEALPWCERAVHLSETKGLIVLLPWAYSTTGWALTLSGQPNDGLPYLERAVTLAERMGIQVNLATVNFLWAEGLLRAGDIPKARPAAERALEFARAVSARGIEADALRILGGIAAGADPPDTDAALTFYEQSRVLGEELGMRPLLARCHLGLGELYGKIGNQEHARSELSTAVELFRAMGMAFWLAEAAAALAQLE